jgi:hypothetical protein
MQQCRLTIDILDQTYHLNTNTKVKIVIKLKHTFLNSYNLRLFVAILDYYLNATM